MRKQKLSFPKIIAFTFPSKSCSPVKIPNVPPILVLCRNINRWLTALGTPVVDLLLCIFCSFHWIRSWNDWKFLVNSLYLTSFGRCVFKVLYGAVAPCMLPIPDAAQTVAVFGTTSECVCLFISWFSSLPMSICCEWCISEFLYSQRTISASQSTIHRWTNFYAFLHICL